MREIKFRAWDGKMIRRVDTIDWGDSMVHNTGSIFRIKANGYNFREDEDQSGWGRLEDVVLMQYTGLKDKNGKEIYEGDIVNEWKNDKYKVYFDKYNASFRLNGIGNRRQHGMSVLSATVTYKIIGNIYENPELLN